jgi:hypothetical protein
MSYAAGILPADNQRGQIPLHTNEFVGKSGLVDIYKHPDPTIEGCEAQMIT